MKNYSNSHAATPRRIPQRTCVACRQIKTKRELVRLVRTPSGDIEIDITGKKPGRGAYVCPDRTCWEKALKGKQLEITLRTVLTRADRDKLLKNAEDLTKGVA